LIGGRQPVFGVRTERQQDHCMCLAFRKKRATIEEALARLGRYLM
jgi:hypothetical protein